MNRQVLAVLALVTATVLTGCGALGGPGSPTAAPEPASTATDADTSTPDGTATATTTPVSTPKQVPVYGDLPVNATLVWERVESMFPGEYEAPPVAVSDGRSGGIAGPFSTHLGLDEGLESVDESGVAGSYSRQTERVQLIPRNGSPAEIERVLAHEFVHAIQYQSDLVDRAGGSQVRSAIIEGSAVYAEEQYTREFLGFSAIERRCERYQNGTPYDRYVVDSYCFGGRYFAEKLDSPADLLDADRRFPNTSEQVLHPGSTEAPTNLKVVDETPTNWSTGATMDRKGELFVRTVLGVELSEQRAVDAAEGWGNDRLLEVTGDTEGYVWVLRWDTDADATAFESAFGDYLDARGERTTDGWTVDDDRYRLRSLDDRTVAVVTGNESFVDAVAVAERSGNVTVSASDERD